MIKYKFFRHTADVKFRAYGKTLEQAFENSALAEFKTMYDGNIEKKIKRRLSVSGKDFESLLYNFLEELLILLDSENLFFSDSDVKIDIKKMKLTADVFFDKASNYKIGLDVKAVTYNEIFVKKIGSRWVCQVVLDV